jgi:S-adenosyl-L-methionine hydrolase (adenosine-forming)
MIFLFTDFGRDGPYVGQVRAVLARAVPDVPVIDLFCDLPSFDPQSSAYLLAAYSQQVRAGDVVMAVVDPGVGGTRDCVVLKADGVWYVGPDNGLLALVQRGATQTQAWSLEVPPDAAPTFHGRDVFAPAAATLAQGQRPAGKPIEPTSIDRTAWPADLAQVVYVDHYGNAMTGLSAVSVPNLMSLKVAGHELRPQRTFADVPRGQAFFYANSNGLWEIACNGGSAALALGLAVGTPVSVVSGADGR